MARFNPFRAFVGTFFAVGSLPGLIYGWWYVYEHAQSVTGLLLGYGVGLLPLVVGMLLCETSLAAAFSWFALAGAVVALPAGTLWLAEARNLFRVHDAGWLPASFLAIGLAVVALWSATLFIRARRRHAAID